MATFFKIIGGIFLCAFICCVWMLCQHIGPLITGDESKGDRATQLRSMGLTFLVALGSLGIAAGGFFIGEKLDPEKPLPTAPARQ